MQHVVVDQGDLLDLVALIAHQFEVFGRISEVLLLRQRGPLAKLALKLRNQWHVKQQQHLRNQTIVKSKPTQNEFKHSLLSERRPGFFSILVESS